MSEIVFNVQLDEDGGYWARANTAAIFVQGDTWGELCKDALSGVEAFYAMEPVSKPKKIRLYLQVQREQELLVA